MRKVKQNADLVISSLESCSSAESFDVVWQIAEQRSKHVKSIIDEEVRKSIDFKEAKLPHRESH